MSKVEKDLSEQSLEELISSISDVRLKYYYGEWLGTDFLSLDGGDILQVMEIQKRFGEEGIAMFNATFGPVVERRAQERIDSLKEGFQRAQSHVHGSPYSPDEPEYIRLKLLGIPNLITTDDYNSFSRRIDAFGGFLQRYRSGEPVEVYLGAKPQEVTGIYGNKGVFPEEGAKTIVLQRPTADST